MDFSEEEVKSLSTSELDAHSSNVKEKNAWAIAEEVCLLTNDSSVPRGYISEFLGVINNQELFSGAWVFFQARTIWEPPL